MSARLFDLALRKGHLLPRQIIKSVLISAFFLAGFSGKSGLLATNLQKLTGKRPNRTYLARAMVSYGRYWAEVIELPKIKDEELYYRVRLEAAPTFIADCQAGNVVVALGHCANWDLIGAWAGQNISPVIAVAEKIKPEYLFDTFVDLRGRKGIQIFPAEGGITKKIVEAVEKNKRSIVALLADRDITGRGVEVPFGTEKALVGAGPAVLSIKLGAPLYCAIPIFERISGLRAKKARNRWGVSLKICGPFSYDAEETAVEELTLAWSRRLSQELRLKPEDWHMLQPLYVSDLDALRLARSRARIAETER